MASSVYSGNCRNMSIFLSADFSGELIQTGDVLRAETSLLNHQMNHLKALYDHSIGKARLKLALGELTLEHCEILRE